MNTINALTFRQKFGEMLDEVVKTGNPLVVERQNKPLVVMYPYEEKKNDLSEIEHRKKRERAGKMIDEWRKRNAKYFKGFDSTKFIRKFRDERYGLRYLKTGSNY